jgi:cation transport regulator ChaC
VEHWVFGYGSLIWKVDFPVLDRRRASVTGWVRRFWQGSHDHRGTPDAPGRVVTLVPEPGAVCEGMAYRITESVFEHLDHREKNGYLRVDTPLLFTSGDMALATTYVADHHNEAFLGPLPTAEIAAQIDRSCGPSGSNREYLLHLAAALRELNVVDEHVFELERHLLALGHSR